MNLRHHLQFSPHNSLIAGLSLYRMHAILEKGHVTYIPGCMFCNYWFHVNMPWQLSGKEKTIECCVAALLYQLHERLCLFNISPNFHAKQVLRQELEAKPSVPEPHRLEVYQMYFQGETICQGCLANTHPTWYTLTRYIHRRHFTKHSPIPPCKKILIQG
jgi:hypothetical protein